MELDQNLEDMTVQHLRVYAKSKGLKIGFQVKKQEIIEMLKNYEFVPAVPVDIYKDPETNVYVVEEFVEPITYISNKTAIYISGGPVASPTLGLLDIGYHVVPKEAMQLLSRSKRVREVSPKELAGAFKGAI